MPLGYLLCIRTYVSSTLNTTLFGRSCSVLCSHSCAISWVSSFCPDLSGPRQAFTTCVSADATAEMSQGSMSHLYCGVSTLTHVLEAIPVFMSEDAVRCVNITYFCAHERAAPVRFVTGCGCSNMGEVCRLAVVLFQDFQSRASAAFCAHFHACVWWPKQHPRSSQHQCA